MSRVAVIGLGEAGRIYAQALAASGHDVIGYDPFVADGAAAPSLAPSAASAASGADAVLVLTAAQAAPTVADECLPEMKPGSTYIDMTSSSPAVMRDLGARASEASFADVAILGPVISLREATPLMVSGPGSGAAAALLQPLGAPVTDIGGEPGDAVARKLVRSVLAKGFAAVVCEAVEAGEAAGFEEWIRQEGGKLLAGGEATVQRYVTGTRKHAARRGQEMDESVAFLAALGVPTAMAQAAADTHHRLTKESSC